MTASAPPRAMRFAVFFAAFGVTFYAWFNEAGKPVGLENLNRIQPTQTVGGLR
jgi:hypothetical protein